MIAIDLSEFHQHLKLKTEDGRQLLFDPVRKNYFVVQPEELVRQSWVHLINKKFEVPFSNLSVERQIKVSGLNKRFDLVLYQKGQAHVLFEFKSFNYKINQNTCMQVANYNFELMVPYIVISNGIEHFAYLVNFHEKSIKALDNLSFLKPT